MRRTELAATFAASLAIGLFACETGPVENTSDLGGEQGEQTESTSEELRRAPGETICAGAECKSGDGLQSCCCTIGDKCVSKVAICECTTAKAPLQSGPARRL